MVASRFCHIVDAISGKHMHGSDMTPREQRIRDRAAQLWEQAGKPQGRDDDFWFEAEVQVAAEEQDNPSQRRR
jgi:hypothetical protein